MYGNIVCAAPGLSWYMEVIKRKSINFIKRTWLAPTKIPGDTVFYESGELHRNFNTMHPSRNINIEIRDSFFSTYDMNVSSFAGAVLNYTNAKFSILKIYHECLTMDEDSQAAIHASLLGLMASRDKTKKTEPEWIKLVSEILNDRWNEQMPLMEIANLVQVHPVTVSKQEVIYSFKNEKCNNHKRGHCRICRTALRIRLDI